MCPVNVVAPRTLRSFWEKHPLAKVALKTWLKEVQKAQFRNLNELQQRFPSADYLSENELTIFNIGGNNYRMITFVRYVSQSIFIKKVMTHAEYDKWNKQGRPLW